MIPFIRRALRRVDLIFTQRPASAPGFLFEECAMTDSELHGDANPAGGKCDA